MDQTTANQERELREIAGRMGCEIVKVYKDHGLSPSGYGQRRSPGPQNSWGPRGPLVFLAQKSSRSVRAALAREVRFIV